MEEDSDLAYRIARSFVGSRFGADTKKFVPADDMERIITVENIKKEFEYGSDNADEELTDLISFVNMKATKLFAIAIYSGMDGSTLIDAMKLFKAQDFTDENLPVRPWKDGETHQLTLLGGPWKKQQRIRLFCIHQWAFLAPIFTAATETLFSYDLERSHVLPFIEKYEEGFQRGAFGQVYKYKIHPSHLRDPENPVEHPRLGKDEESLTSL